MSAVASYSFQNAPKPPASSFDALLVPGSLENTRKPYLKVVLNHKARVIVPMKMSEESAQRELSLSIKHDISAGILLPESNCSSEPDSGETAKKWTCELKKSGRAGRERNGHEWESCRRVGSLRPAYMQRNKE